MHIMVHPPKVGLEGNIDYIIQESIYFWSCTLAMVKDHNILRFFYLSTYLFFIQRALSWILRCLSADILKTFKCDIALTLTDRSYTKLECWQLTLQFPTWWSSDLVHIRDFNLQGLALFLMIMKASSLPLSYFLMNYSRLLYPWHRQRAFVIANSVLTITVTSVWYSYSTPSLSQFLDNFNKYIKHLNASLSCDRFWASNDIHVRTVVVPL